MAVQRLCTIEDKPYLRALWKDCFEDSDGFLDFFFEKRFCPEYTVCTIEDGKLVNAMYSLPINMFIRGHIVPAAMLAGFSTDADYRGRGYMSKAFKLLIDNLSRDGITVAPHTPAKHDNYFHLGNYSATDTMFIEGVAVKPKTLPQGISFGRMSEIGKIYPVYMKFAEKYSGMSARSFLDFVVRMQDLDSDGGEFIIAEKNDEIKGYALYFNAVESFSAIEVVFDDESTAERILNALAFIADNKPIEIKLPPDCTSEVEGCTKRIIPHGVAAPVNLPKLMGMIFEDDDIIIKLKDDISDINNGTFRINGVPCENDADIEADAGHFLQFVEGYKTLEELVQEGAISIKNKDKIHIIDEKYRVCKCFICDEY